MGTAVECWDRRECDAITPKDIERCRRQISPSGDTGLRDVHHVRGNYAGAVSGPEGYCIDRRRRGRCR